jgi:hypothetical protein
MLSLCESIDQPIHIFLDRPARPILLTNAFSSIDKNAVMTHGSTEQADHIALGFPNPYVKSQLDVVLATLQEETTQTQAPAQTQTQAHSAQQQENRDKTPSTQPQQQQHQPQHQYHQQQHARSSEQAMMPQTAQSKHVSYHDDSRDEKFDSERTTAPIVNVFSNRS